MKLCSALVRAGGELSAETPDAFFASAGAGECSPGTLRPPEHQCAISVLRRVGDITGSIAPLGLRDSFTLRIAPTVGRFDSAVRDPHHA